MRAREGAGRTEWHGRWPQLLLAVLVLLVVVQAVRLMWAVTVPTGPLGAWQQGTAQLLSGPERQTLFAGLDPFFRSDARGAPAGTVTALDLALFGITMNEGSGGGSAIIAGPDGVQSSFAVGDAIVAGVTLAGIAFDHVILDRSGARESLFIDQSQPTGAATGTSAVAPMAAPAPSPATGGGEINPQALQAGIGFAPRSESGKVTGLTVQPQGDGAVFRAAGLRPGDVIRAVNGRPVSSTADIAAQIAPGARLSLEVERGSAVVPIALFLGKP